MAEVKKFTTLLPSFVENFFIKLRQGTSELDYGRTVIVSMISSYLEKRGIRRAKILDIGVGGGVDLENVVRHCESAEFQLFGVDSYKPNVENAIRQGIQAHCLSIERQTLPFEDKSIDIIIANQVVEHTKDVYFIFSEISRILKPGGIVIVGIPNLAAFHNRILLLLGQQPTCIRLPGPHVRGFTKGAFRSFLELDDYFEVLDVKGSNFFPFPPAAARLLSRLFPSLAISLFFLCKRTSKPGKFIEVLDSRFYETDFFRGD